MKYAINLFPSKRSFLSVLTNFLIYYLRYALIITLFVIVVIFFLRMQLDQKLINEQQKLSQKKAIIQATEGIRNDLEKIQKKVKDVSVMLKKQDKLVEVMNYVASVIPSGLEVKTFEITDELVIINASIKDFRKIQSFQKRLQKDAKFGTIDLGEISSDNEGNYTFTLKLVNWKTKQVASSEKDNNTNE